MICKHPIIRQLKVDRRRAAGRGSAGRFEFSLRPWLRQGQATGAHLPVLVPLRLVGVPAHAWTKKTAEVLLRGCGFVEQVAERMARRFDMSAFHVWLRTDDPTAIPSQRRLFIKEPTRGRHGLVSDTPTALCYPISISQLAPPARLDAPGDAGSPPPPSPPSRSGGRDDSSVGGDLGRGPSTRPGAGRRSASVECGGSCASSVASAPPARGAVTQAAVAMPAEASCLAPMGPLPLDLPDVGDEETGQRRAELTVVG